MATFSSGATGCAPINSTFRDQSLVTQGIISGWLWNFGDGGGLVPPLLVAAAFLAAVTPAAAQVDFSGQWAPVYHEDNAERIPGPELADYTGLSVEYVKRYDLRIDRPLPTALEAEKMHFYANLLLRQGRFAEASKLLQGWQGPADWTAYAKFNLGVALVRDGKLEQAEPFLRDVGSLQSSRNELLGLRLAERFERRRRIDGLRRFTERLAPQALARITAEVARDAAQPRG